MKNSTYREMLIEYGNDLDSYKDERELLLSKYNYSIILEGEFTELENLETWIKENIDTNEIESIYYDKIDYNYCFVEYFFSLENHALLTQDVVPRIFSTYQNIQNSPNIFKTYGVGKFIEYDNSIQNVIVL